METTTVTGIPTDYLFLIVGALIGAIYLDIKRELRSLRKDANSRVVTLGRITLALRFVCRKLNIPFDANDEDEKSHE